ncbi:MAG: XRE family transcriptional regulator [Alphaproteobacteria bacterium]|nr:MAG: XRE family transcriptional regulator [Alphaproteobacteria bacterium]
MLHASDLSEVVRSRRSDMGLSQARLSALCGLSRATVNQIEQGTIKELGLSRAARLLGVLGLSLDVNPAGLRRGSKEGRRTSALQLAARSASVSYRTPLTEAALREVILEDVLRDEFEPHLNALLEDGSVALLAAIAEELHQSQGVERAAVWAQLRLVARRLGSRRDLWE